MKKPAFTIAFVVGLAASSAPAQADRSAGVPVERRVETAGTSFTR